MEDSSVETISCEKEGCTVDEDGKCLEGLALEDCPHFQKEGDEEGSPSIEEEAIEEDTEAHSSEAENEEDAITFHSGDPLDISSASKLTRSALTRVIILAGPPKSGKTTLLACLNERFQRGSFAGYLFSGSRTLQAFEERCHTARLRSKKSYPDTTRTRAREGVQFLHLKLRDNDLRGSAQDILFSDISGEIFDRSRNSAEEARNLGVVRRSDHFNLLIDGDKLTDLAERQSARTKGKDLLMRYREENLLDQEACVNVIFTKWDLVVGDRDAKQFAERIKEELSNEFENSFSRLRFFQVSARPESGNQLDPGYGMEELLETWVEKTPRISKPEIQVSDTGSPTREFARFKS